MRYAPATVAALVLFGFSVVAPDAQQNPRTLGSGAGTTTTVDFSAVDAKGQPVTDLNTADVTVRIDGKPRDVRALQYVRREKPTLRQLLASLAGARGHFVFAGTPEQVADLIEDWFTHGAADGFNIMPPLLPAMLDVFSAEVIPILQKRGLFRTAYEGKTLREHYGLPWPQSAFDAKTLQHA